MPNLSDFYFKGKGSFGSERKKCSSTEKLLVTDSTHAVSPVSELHQPITTAPSASNAIVEAEIENGLEKDEAVPVTLCNKRSLTNEPSLNPLFTQCSISEKPSVECIVVQTNTGKPEIKSEIRHKTSFTVPHSSYECHSVNQPGLRLLNNVKLKYGTEHRRHRRCYVNEAVIVRAGEQGNNVCIRYRHGDQQKKTPRDATKISGIVKAARPSVHSNGSYSSSCLQQAAAAFSHPSSVPEVVRVDTNGGKAGISSIQSTGLINASITNTTPNSFAQSKHPKASIPTFKTSSNEQNLDAPDTQSVDVCSPVTKTTWNHLPDFQIVPSSRWQPVNHDVSSGYVDSQLQEIRTSGSNSSGPAKPIETRLIPIPHINAGRRPRYRVKEELYRRYSAPSTESHNSQQGKVCIHKPIISSSKEIIFIPTANNGRTHDNENNNIESDEFQSLLYKHHSLDYDTLNIVPTVSKCQNTTMENLQNAWKRTRPPLPRGNSLCNTQTANRTERQKVQSGRPKSAEFLLEDTRGRVSYAHIRKIGHVRSPSDGDKTLLLALENNKQNDFERNQFDERNNDATNDKNPGFLRKMFTFTRRSRSRESEEGSTKNRSRPLTSKKSSKRWRSLTGSRSRSPSNRSRSPSNTSSMESSESYNNNTAPVMDNKFSGINSRRYIRMYNEIDENKNIEAPSPPIAVWSSDEDISSAPSTPRRKSQGSDHSSPRRVVFRKFSDSRDPRILKTISPELEEQISATLREPSKLKREISETAQVESEGLCVTRYRGSPRRFIPNQRLKKYGINRHHSAEAPIPETPAPTHQPLILGPRQPPRGPLLQHTRLKNYTIDLSNFVIREPDDDKSRGETPIHRKNSNSENRADHFTHNMNNPFYNLRADGSLGCVPQSSTSTAPGYNYQTFPYISTQDSYSYPTSEQSDYITRRGIITRTSWGRRSQLSPGDPDAPVTMGLVENISTDSGIQQDSYESSNESLKVSVINILK